MTKKQKRGFVLFMTAFVLVAGLKYYNTKEGDFEALAVAAEAHFNDFDGDAVYVGLIPERTEEVLPPIVTPPTENEETTE